MGRSESTLPIFLYHFLPFPSPTLSVDLCGRRWLGVCCLLVHRITCVHVYGGLRLTMDTFLYNSFLNKISHWICSSPTGLTSWPESSKSLLFSAHKHCSYRHTWDLVSNPLSLSVHLSVSLPSPLPYYLIEFIYQRLFWVIIPMSKEEFLERIYKEDW